MPLFKVRCYRKGVWDEVPPVTIEAVSMIEAAELVSGHALERSGTEDRLRAAVWAAGAIPEPVFFFRSAVLRPIGIVVDLPGRPAPSPPVPLIVPLNQAANVVVLRTSANAARGCRGPAATRAQDAEPSPDKVGTAAIHASLLRYLRENDGRIARQRSLIDGGCASAEANGLLQALLRARQACEGAIGLHRQLACIGECQSRLWIGDAGTRAKDIAFQHDMADMADQTFTCRPDRDRAG